jgi:hypothetical protein
MIINVAKDFSRVPGFRYETQSPGVSGEEFRIKCLKPAYIKACESNEKLTVILDGVVGYLTSFLEESFGGLQREILDRNILDNIEIVSNDEPHWKEQIKKYVIQAIEKRNA